MVEVYDGDGIDHGKPVLPPPELAKALEDVCNAGARYGKPPPEVKFPGCGMLAKVSDRFRAVARDGLMRAEIPLFRGELRQWCASQEYDEAGDNVFDDAMRRAMELCDRWQP